jgi:hypothetical protein
MEVNIKKKKWIRLSNIKIIKNLKILIDEKFKAQIKEVLNL